MGKQGPRPATSGDWLLVTGVMAMMLGLVIAGAGLLASAPDSDEVGGRSPHSAGVVLPGAAAPPLIVGSGDLGRPTCGAEALHAPRAEPAAFAPSAEDPREYLESMATLPHRRASPAATVDPYRASLNPAVYRPRGATPMADGRSPGGPRGDTCRYP